MATFGSDINFSLPFSGALTNAAGSLRQFYTTKYSGCPADYPATSSSVAIACSLATALCSNCLTRSLEMPSLLASA